MKRANPVTRYLTPAECDHLNVIPYAVYGGKVYSLKARIPGRSEFEHGIIAHGSERYSDFVAMVDAGKRAGVGK